jgi:hypothetical protein
MTDLKMGNDKTIGGRVGKTIAGSMTDARAKELAMLLSKADKLLIDLEASGAFGPDFGSIDYPRDGDTGSASMAIPKPLIARLQETIDEFQMAMDEPSASGSEKSEDDNDKIQEKGKDQTNDITALSGDNHAGGLPSTKPHLTMVSLWLLDILQRIRSHRYSWPFWALVSPDVCPGYYGECEPIHFGIIKQKVKANHYDYCDGFMDDIYTVLGHEWDLEGERYYAHQADELKAWVLEWMMDSPRGTFRGLVGHSGLRQSDVKRAHGRGIAI